MKKEREQLTYELKLFICNTTWTQKIQIKQADIYKKKMDVFTWGKILSSVLTSLGIGSEIFLHWQYSGEIAFSLSLITILVSAISENLDYYRLYTETKDHSDKIRRIRDRALSLLSNLKFETKELQDIERQFERIMTIKNELYDNLNNPSSKAIVMAEQGLENGERNYDDLDTFIPNYLKD
ncbi:SLATT domain-containing protein [Enterococcus rotai]|uniref:SLATT domain-containing protein n=1 Tax=Enterococcus rotai TaxID=118060 RepID=UPI0032B3D439